MAEILHAAWRSGSVASVTSALALLVGGERDLGNAITPLNGPSQWLLGRRAVRQDGFRLPHTVLGYAIHHGSSIFWAACYEATHRHPRRARALSDCVLPAIATGVVAAFVDLIVSPPRLRPGFERRLSATSLVLVYLAFAGGLAVTRYARRPPAGAHAGPPISDDDTDRTAP